MIFGKAYCDLHTHSCFSDGTDTPAQIIEAAEKLKLSHVALCDHNTVDGVPEFVLSARDKRVEAVAGIELSTDYGGTELHLLGLFLPHDRLRAVADFVKEANERKEQSNIRMIESLKRAGFNLDYDKIKATTPNGKVNRSNVADYMLEHKMITSKAKAFETILSPEAGHYVEPKRLSVWEALDFLKLLNAAPILAHPLLNLKYKELYDFLKKAKDCGLLGLECHYSLYSSADTDIMMTLAKHFDLLPSGGSDYHGKAKPDISLGVGKAALRVPSKFAENIKEKLK
ncbi:MAG: PHP domain-containing protein [Clostridia bacterium]|nr:PHP domain-containing protein [Clostridia bacterium]